VFWLQMLSELNHRGVEAEFLAVCDGRKGLSDSVETVFGPGPRCRPGITHLVRYTSRYFAKKY
jgi:putative transposase